MLIDKALTRGYVLSPLAAAHHRRDGLVSVRPSAKGKQERPSPDGGRGRASLAYEQVPAPRLNDASAFRAIRDQRSAPGTSATRRESRARSLTALRGSPQTERLFAPREQPCFGLGIAPAEVIVQWSVGVRPEVEPEDGLRALRVEHRSLEGHESVDDRA